jgi:hypothetical protein
MFKKKRMLGEKNMFNLLRGNGRWKKRKNNVHQMMGESDGRRNLFNHFKGEGDEELKNHCSPIPMEN